MTTKASDILRILLYVSNFILLLCSMALLTVLLLSLVHGKQYLDLTGKYTSLYLFGTVMIVVIIMFGASILGCCGVANQSIRMLTVYLVIMSILIVVLVTCGIIGWMKKDDAFGDIAKGLEDSISKYQPSSTHELTEAIDDIQEYLHCCGINSTADWHKVPSYRTGRVNNFPQSCKDTETDSAYVDGCLLKIREWLKDNLWNIGFSIAGTVVFMMMSVCVVCIMIGSIHRETHYDVERKNLTYNQGSSYN